MEYFKKLNFRNQLKKELPRLTEKGIISPEQSVQISGYYNLDQLGQSARTMLGFAIFIIGAVLLAAGAISFVSANWDKMSPIIRVCILVSAMLGSHIVGYYLWKISGKSHHLGHSLILLGTLILGANIGLFAQIFHIHSDIYNGLFLWSLGAFGVALAIVSIPNMLLAIVVSFIAFLVFTYDNSGVFPFYPFVLGGVALPFAHYHRSGAVCLAGVLGLSVSMVVYSLSGNDSFANFCFASLCGGLFLIGLGAIYYNHRRFKPVGLAIVTVGIVSISLLSYVLSFHGLSIDWKSPESQYWLFLSVLMLILSGVFVTWSYLRYKYSLSDKIIVASVIIASVIAISQLLWIPESPEIFQPLAGNLACLSIIIGLLTAAFISYERRFFWMGILFAFLIITSRFFEYRTSLLLKSAVFTVCGIAVITSGLFFENLLKSGENKNAD